MNVLVIDDDIMIHLLMKETLSLHGFEVIAALNGEAGIKQAIERCPDIILLDVFMPDMNGFACLEILLERLQTCCANVPPIVMLTGLEDSEAINRAFEMGAADFIHKPVIWPLLEHRLQFVLRSHQLTYELKLKEERLRLSMTAAHQGSYDFDIKTGLSIVNDEYANMLGYDPTTFEETYSTWLDRLHPDDRETVENTLRSYLAGELSEYRVEFRIACKNGAWKWILSVGNVIERDSGGIPKRMLGMHTNIDSLKQADERLKLLAKVFENIGESVVVCNADKEIIEVNRAFTEVTGYRPDEIIGKNPRILQSGRHNKDFYVDMWDSLNTKSRWSGEIWNRRKNGEIYPEHLSITVIKDKEGNIVNYIASFNDITIQKEASDKIERLAFYDPLTNLPNRRLLQDRLKLALESSQRRWRKGALMFIDMDNFKTLNDSLGHAMGDILLQEVAHRLKLILRESDTVARLGGDEFVLMLVDLKSDEIGALAQVEEIAHKIIVGLSQPYQLGMHEYHCSSSIGITFFDGYECSAQELLKQSDIAMYQAKALGGNTMCFFTPQMQSKISAHVALEADLREAIEKKQFRLFYQAQVNHHHQIIGAETLIRWQHPQRGMVSPVEFISLAEETDLILFIGDWVLEAACAQLKIWKNNRQTQHLKLSVNVSAKQFHQHDFVEKVHQVIRRNAINPSNLKLELTETMVLNDIDDTLVKMHKLHKLGVSFAMDDFGTGHSSLSILKKLPFDQLKIDQSFVRDISIDQDDAIIVKTIIDMAANLGMEVIAEGVETVEQCVFLEQNNCLNYQGYLFSKPVPIEQFELLLEMTPIRIVNGAKDQFFVVA